MQHWILMHMAFSSMGVHYKALGCLCVYSITAKDCFSIFKNENVLTCLEPVKESPCTSDLTYFRQDLPVGYEATEITAFSGDYQQPVPSERKHTVAAYPRVINCMTGLAIGKKSTLFSRMNTHHKRMVFNEWKWYPRLWNTHYMPLLQPSTPCLAGTSMDQFAVHQPSHQGVYSRGKPFFNPKVPKWKNY